ncbi:hypothetical protein UFOVP1247_80 [uncultured Caudovirales phage]|jgi:hypothetical protein|uniref:Uncharacterized protein n=1 Tax=uncultured Caudovirales phage TaxID=2100421 RepID=A0A6J5R901_9CAUD|nr:hypothetical protein UFOVP970_120 [uncultured Caudovirales phage]CAB4193459.1 hypothetical protein UFOVP1247_80 [uncultured Caudovirales phage]
MVIFTYNLKAEMMTLEQGKVVSQILERFDFEKVLKHMQSVGWKWFDEVPDMDDIKGTACRLLIEAIEDPQEVVSMGTGGFRVYKLPWGLELTFSIERSGSF